MIHIELTSSTRLNPTIGFFGLISRINMRNTFTPHAALPT